MFFLTKNNFLSKNIEIFYSKSRGSTNQIQELEEIIKKDPDSNSIDIKNKNSLFNIPMSNGRTLLYIACQEGKTEIIEFLLEKGLDPSIKSIVHNRINIR